MPAVSKAQRRAMAIALNAPRSLKPQNRSLRKMTDRQLRDFASTPEQGLTQKAPAAGSIREVTSRSSTAPAQATPTVTTRRNPIANLGTYAQRRKR